MDKHIKTHKDGSYHFTIVEDIFEKIKVETVLDIGCNTGDIMVNYINLIKPKFIYGFEANKKNFKKASEKVKYYSGAKVFHATVSDYDGTGTLFLTKDNGCNSILKPFDALKPIGEELVKVIRIDTWAKENNISGVDFVKIDVQGNELKVLQGMGDFIHAIKIIKVELWFREDEYYNTPMYYDVAAFLKTKGMTLYNFSFLMHSNSNELRWGDAIFIKDSGVLI